MKAFWLIIFSISMAFLEAAVVVYLRGMYYPEGFSFPLRIISREDLIIELIREAATICMLISVSALCGKRFWEKFSYFLILFGIWDIFYYIWLKITIGWASSLFDWDLLFLIPLPWIGPVIAPLIVALTMIGAGLLVIRLYNRGYDFRPSFLTWFFAVTGTIIILYSFMNDTGAGLYQQMPLPYRYELLVSGEVLYALALCFAWKNTIAKSSRGNA